MQNNTDIQSLRSFILVDKLGSFSNIHYKYNQAQLLKAFSQPSYIGFDAVELRQLKSLGVAGKDVT